MLSQESTPSRPVSRLATAIYEQAAIQVNGDTRETVLAYRDRLRDLQQLRRQCAATLRRCVGPDARDVGASDDATTGAEGAFSQARQLLSVDSLARIAPSELLTHCNSHLQRLSQEIAGEFLRNCEAELGRGRIGEFRRFNGTLARCRCPSRTLNSQFPSPETAMLSEVASDSTSGGAPSESATTTVEFFIGLDAALTDAPRIRQAFRPPQLLFEKAPLALRPFIRVVSGSPYRDCDELGKGGFTALVLFHYVFDWWTEDTQKSVASMSPRSSSRVPRPLLMLATAVVCLIVGVTIGREVQLESSSPDSASQIKAAGDSADRASALAKQETPLACITLSAEDSIVSVYELSCSANLSDELVKEIFDQFHRVHGVGHRWVVRKTIDGRDLVVFERDRMPEQQITKYVQYSDCATTKWARPLTDHERVGIQPLAQRIASLLASGGVGNPTQPLSGSVSKRMAAFKGPSIN